MALTLSSGGNSEIAFATSGLTDFPYGTAAALIWLTTNVATGALSVIFIGTGISADEIDILSVYASPANAPGYWNSTANADAIATSGGVTTGRWTLIAAGKDTGAVAPRCHIFDFASNTWTHSPGSVTSADAAVTAQSAYVIGGAATLGFPGIAGEVAATAAWYKRNLSDAEIERLPAGSWNRYSPDTMCEFRSGRTPLGVGPADHGRERMPMTNFGSAITRTARADPPGFRWSLAGRRR